ncbi:HAMP domain-containing sensor histidine kinase [Marinicella sp. S1101]|uniref:HAMP domain-containing sensor histidine kinase n=1 Tax=Marinicella marina TaxID=2996016 RepID=UPI002260C9EA|nr:HAMP domain-containing sensor histidine kinase [Marinicella marina]MCX7552985.1 HAMP domain-containing sensor histidine kinase [Marinicella marina]MDJ1139705.1 HAMP domain-containing sensor histidine kinase [Marinicella marina]
MNFRSSIKSRIIIAFLAFSTLLTILFAISSLSIRQYLQNDLIAQTIQEDLDAYMLKLSSDPDLVENEQVSTTFEAFITTPSKFHTNLPLHYGDLEEGTHVLSEAGKTYIVAVNKRHQLNNQPVWGFVRNDITHIDSNPQTLFIAFAVMFLVFLLLAYILANYVSAKALKPLSKLAAKLEKQHADTHLEPLAGYFHDDEVGQVAKALDAYAQKLTDYVIRDKEFNADVSHELRTPLTVIKSTVELIKSNPKISAKELDRINRIERATKQSTELTETLLLLAREERKEHPGHERTQPGQIIRTIIEGFEPTLKLKPVKTKITENDWLQVKAPESVVSVVLSNLIGNAIKYTTEGTVHVIINKDSITVEDEGIGVTESELPKLFDRHYRVGKSNSKGSGLGLAIVKRLCDLYNWNIEIKQNNTTGLSATLTFN